MYAHGVSRVSAYCFRLVGCTEQAFDLHFYGSASLRWTLLAGDF